MECFHFNTTAFSSQYLIHQKIRWGLVIIFTLADHLVFEPVQPVKQSIQVHEQFQGLNYMVETKKAVF